jgi:uncharacterized membrane protein
MAGIGFTLRKVITKGSLGTFLKAAFSGIMIVAGPWILSIIALSVISSGLGSSTRDLYNLFLSVSVYSYAIGLVVFSAVHYTFTRLIADLIWEKKENLASSYLLQLLVATIIVSTGIAVLLFGIQDFSFIPEPGLFQFSAILFFVSMNLLWIIMLFVSLLKWYIRVLVIYFSGLAIAVILIIVLEPSLGIAGSMFGFAIGHFAIALALLILSLAAYPAKKAGSVWPKFWHYFKRYSFLIQSGVFFYAALWGDKIFYWLTRGIEVSGTWFLLSPDYDVAVFFANLSIIPGLVYFVIIGETGFYTSFRRFLIALSDKPYIQIQRAKYELISSLKQELFRQSILQAIIALCLILLSPILPIPRDITNPLLFSIATLGVFFQLLNTTLINYYYYFEDYKRPAIGALLFLILTLAFNTILSIIAFPSELSILNQPGIGLVLAGLVVSLILFPRIIKDGQEIDRVILIRNSQGY